VSVPGAKSVDLTIGSTKVEVWDSAKWQAALNAAGYPAKADLKVNWFMAELILVIMVTIGPFYAKPELLIGFAAAVACTIALRFMLQATYLTFCRPSL
jgi:hypothetical protein